MAKEFKEVETIIGSTVKVEGDFKGSGDIVVEGMFNGTLTTKGNLSVGENAVIKANVEASSAIVAGKVIGNLVIAEHLELASTAEVKGDIITKALTISTGASVNGNIKMEGTKDIVPEGEEDE